MAKIAVNGGTLTEVLIGSGYCVGDKKMEYFVGDTAADALAAGRHRVNEDVQYNGLDGKTIWGRLISDSEGFVTSHVE